MVALNAAVSAFVGASAAVALWSLRSSFRAAVARYREIIREFEETPPRD